MQCHGYHLRNSESRLTRTGLTTDLRQRRKIASWRRIRTKRITTHEIADGKMQKDDRATDENTCNKNNIVRVFMNFGEHRHTLFRRQLTNNDTETSKQVLNLAVAKVLALLIPADVVLCAFLLYSSSNSGSLKRSVHFLNVGAKPSPFLLFD